MSDNKIKKFITNKYKETYGNWLVTKDNETIAYVRL